MTTATDTALEDRVGGVLGRLGGGRRRDRGMRRRQRRRVIQPIAHHQHSFALGGEFGEARIFRPYRDVRFSADKTPYKTEQGAIASAPGGAGYYVQISADGLRAGGGFRTTNPTQTARFRAAVDAPAWSGDPPPPLAPGHGLPARAGGDFVNRG